MGNNLVTQTQSEQNSTARGSNCNIYNNFKIQRNSSFLGITGFEGIPQNLVTNIFGWLTLHILFIFLRKKAWNYGRMAVMQKNEIKWTDMFYGGYDDDNISTRTGNKLPIMIASSTSSYQIGTSELPNTTTTQPPLQESPPEIKSSVSNRPLKGAGPATAAPTIRQREGNEDKGEERINMGGSNSNIGRDNNNEIHISIAEDANAASDQGARISEIRDTGYFSWIKIVYRLTDQQYKDKCGQDCVFYLSFQRHLIALASVITLCSIVIILPINVHTTFTQDHLKKARVEFVDTTLINLEKEYSFIWAHIILAITYLFMSIYIMRKYSKKLQFMDEEDGESSRTVAIRGLNKENCQEGMLRAHFDESYPGADITEISFAYDIAALQIKEFSRLEAISAKIYCEERLEQERQKENPNTFFRPKIRPYVCGVVGGCFCRGCCGKCRETDAIEYYTEQVRKFTEEVEEERKRAINTPLGIAFVTFSSVEYAERIVEDYAFSARLFLRTPTSKHTNDLNSNHWFVKYAPPPEDINWENLCLNFKMWYLKLVLVNIALVVLAVLFSTPVSLLQFILSLGPDKQDHAKEEKHYGKLASIVVDTLPTIYIWISGVLLIWMVARSDIIIGFWTKTSATLSEMIKVFVFLIVMIIILPSIGVKSIARFFTKEFVSVSWACIFYKENGAFFVNYICTSSLAGTAAELMRLPELLVYALKLSLARSKAEVGAIRKSVLWDFQIGSSYAWTMLHFGIFTCFSIIYPLVTPFGLMYLVFKHWIDRYNIYFAYAPCKVDKNVHGTAVNFVIVCMFMLQINLLAYVHFQLGENYNSYSTVGGPNITVNTDPEVRALQVFSLLGFSITAALFLGQLCFNACADFSPIHHLKSITQDNEEEPLPPQSEEGHEDHNHNEETAMDRQEEHNKTLKGVGSVTSLVEKKPTAAAVADTTEGKVNRKTRVRPSQERKEARPPEIQASSSVPPSATGSEESQRHSISSNNSSVRPYGKYIPPLLRSEFIRLGIRRRRRRN